ncbi:MAG: hypothetical protein KGY43_07140, partial [Halodesulfurarchaeum sp.]|nr:hypothetical protein [Halodesulfurarchaeum sp.]
MRGITQAIVAVLLVVGAVSVAGVGLATDHDGGKIAQSEVDDVALNHDAAQERPDGGSREQSDEDAARADNNEADRSDEDDAADDGNDTRLSMMGGEVYSWGHSHVENGDGDSSQPDEDDRERSEQTSDGDDIQQRTSTVVTVVNSSLDGREGSMEVMEFHHQVVLVDGIEDGESNTETDEVSQKRAEAGAGDGVDGEATTVESRMKMFIKIDGMPVAGPDGSGDGNVTERATACCMKAFIKIEEMPNASAIIDTGTKVEYVQHTLEVSSVSGNGDDIILGDYLLPSIVGGDDDVSQRASTVVTVVSSPTGGREGSMDVMEFHHEIVRVDGQEGQQSTESSLSQNRAEVGSGHNAHRSPSEVDGADDGSDARSMTGNGTDTAVGWRHHYDYYWYSNPNDTGPEVEYFRYTLDVNRGPGLADDDLPCWFPPLGPGPYNPQPEEPCPSIDTAASSDISVNTGAQSDADSDTDGLGDGIELAIHNESIIEATIGGGGGNSL